MFMTELRCKIGLRSAEKVPKLVNRKQVGNKKWRYVLILQALLFTLRKLLTLASSKEYFM